MKFHCQAFEFQIVPLSGFMTPVIFLDGLCLSAMVLPL